MLRDLCPFYDQHADPSRGVDKPGHPALSNCARHNGAELCISRRCQIVRCIRTESVASERRQSAHCSDGAYGSIAVNVRDGDVLSSSRQIRQQLGIMA